MKKLIKLKFENLGLHIGILSLIFPAVVSAQYNNGFFYNSYLTFGDVVYFFLGLIGKSIPILISISVIIFVWGVFRYVMYEGEDRQKSKDIILYGVIGLFVMVSVWGLVALVYNTLGLGNASNFFFRGGGNNGGNFNTDVIYKKDFPA